MILSVKEEMFIVSPCMMFLCCAKRLCKNIIMSGELIVLHMCTYAL